MSTSTKFTMARRMIVPLVGVGAPVTTLALVGVTVPPQKECVHTAPQQYLQKYARGFSVILCTVCELCG